MLKRRDIIMNYLKTWFIFDLFASFPYTWVVSDGLNFMENSSTEGEVNLASNAH